MDLERCREYLQQIEQGIENPVTLYFDGELPENVLLPTPNNSLSSQVLDGTISQVYPDISFVSDRSFGKSWLNATSGVSGRISSSLSPHLPPHLGWQLSAYNFSVTKFNLFPFKSQHSFHNSLIVHCYDLTICLNPFL